MREKRENRFGDSGKCLVAAAMMLMVLLGGINIWSVGVWGSRAGAEGRFMVECQNRMLSYHENVFSLQMPEAGEVTISIQDAHHTYIRMTERLAAGRQEMTWDGLGWNGERLNSKVYQVCCRLEGESGKTYEHSFSTYVDYSAQALIFGLPGSDTIYLDQPNSWFVEGKTVLQGTVELQLRTEGRDEVILTARKEVAGGKILKMVFPEIWKSGRLEEGRYTARIYEVSNPGYESSFEITVREKTPEGAGIPVTGDIMPKEGDSDEEIWRKMRMTGVVADIPNLEHQKIYQEPDTESPSLGTIHGQTQSLSVYETNAEWTRVGAWNHEEAEYVEGWVPTAVLKTAEPQGPYGLLLNKKEQTLTIYREGKVIETLMVSTGRMQEGELYQETAAGSFFTGPHRTDYSTNGQKYDFVIQYDGGNLLHQIPYAWGNDQKDFTEGRALLGSKGSHACIRVQADPGEKGLNAYWIWTHIPHQTRLIILDDPEERRKAKALVTGETPAYDEMPLVDSLMEEYEDEDGWIRRTFGGDVALGGRETYLNRKDSIFAKMAEEGVGYPFSGLGSVFEGDDWTSVNLECVLKADPAGEDVSKTWRFRGLPGYAEALPAGSVEMVNIANNHTIDYGEAGVAATMAALEGKAAVCGNGRNIIVKIKGHDFGFGGCRETTYKEDPGIIGRDIAELREKGAEIVIYQCHWGVEYAPHRSALQEAMARACVRAGADAVIGHHPHVAQGMDVIDGVPVLYSLGNCCFGGTIQLSTYDGLLAQVGFLFEEDGSRKTAVRLIPILTSWQAEERINDYRPVIAEKENKTRIMRLVQEDTGFSIKEIYEIGSY